MKKIISAFAIVFICAACCPVFTGCGNAPKDFEITKVKSTGYLFDFSIRFTDENELQHKESFSYGYIVNSAYDGKNYITKGENTINGGTIKKDDGVKRYPSGFKVSKTNSILGSSTSTFLFQTYSISPPAGITSEIFDRYMNGKNKTFYNKINTFEDLKNKNGIIVFHAITNGSTSSNSYDYYLSDPDLVILIAVQVNIS